VDPGRLRVSHSPGPPRLPQSRCWFEVQFRNQPKLLFDFAGSSMQFQAGSMEEVVTAGAFMLLVLGDVAVAAAATQERQLRHAGRSSFVSFFSSRISCSSRMTICTKPSSLAFSSTRASSNSVGSRFPRTHSVRPEISGNAWKLPSPRLNRSISSLLRRRSPRIFIVMLLRLRDESRGASRSGVRS